MAKEFSVGEKSSIKAFEENKLFSNLEIHDLRFEKQLMIDNYGLT